VGTKEIVGIDREAIGSNWARRTSSVRDRGPGQVQVVGQELPPLHMPIAQVAVGEDGLRVGTDKVANGPWSGLSDDLIAKTIGIVTWVAEANQIRVCRTPVVAARVLVISCSVNGAEVCRE